MRAALLLALLALAGCSEPVTTQGIRVATALCAPHGGIDHFTQYANYNGYAGVATITIDDECKNGTRVISADIPRDGL